MDATYLYTADDERIAAVYLGAGPATEEWTLRDLDGKVLREYQGDLLTFVFGDGFETGDVDCWDATVQGPTSGSCPPPVRLGHHRRYIRRDGLLLASQGPPSEGTLHYHLDHLGTPREISDGSGNLESASYFAYGEQLETPTLGSDVPLKFTGHERDLNATGGQTPEQDDLDYMHARYYSPVIGRFLSPDPVPPMTMARKSPQAWNLYAYAAGNPIRYTDPDGLFLELPGDCIGLECAEVDLLRTTLIEASAAEFADQLSLDSEGRLRPVAKSFEDTKNTGNETVSRLARIINDDRGVRFSVTTADLSSSRGARTRFSADGFLNIDINLDQVSRFRAPMTPTDGVGANSLLVLMAITPGEAVMHEFGHVGAVFRGFNLRGDASNREAVKYENSQRSLRLGGRALFQRKEHDGGVLVPP